MLGFETKDVGEIDTEEDFKRLEFNLTNYKSKVLEYLLNKYDKKKSI